VSSRRIGLAERSLKNHFSRFTRETLSTRAATASPCFTWYTRPPPPPPGPVDLNACKKPENRTNADAFFAYTRSSRPRRSDDIVRTHADFIDTIFYETFNYSRPGGSTRLLYIYIYIRAMRRYLFLFSFCSRYLYIISNFFSFSTFPEKKRRRFFFFLQARGFLSAPPPTIAWLRRYMTVF